MCLSPIPDKKSKMNYILPKLKKAKKIFAPPLEKPKNKWYNDFIKGVSS
jgi:hypothetical protein